MGDRHSVVVEDDNEIRVAITCVVEGFISLTACQSTVTDDRYNAIILMEYISGLHNAKTR